MAWEARHCLTHQSHNRVAVRVCKLKWIQELAGSTICTVLCYTRAKIGKDAYLNQSHYRKSFHHDCLNFLAWHVVSISQDVWIVR